MMKGPKAGGEAAFAAMSTVQLAPACTAGAGLISPPSPLAVALTDSWPAATARLSTVSRPLLSGALDEARGLAVGVRHGRICRA